MANICDVCGKECATPASLGSHQRLHRKKEVKARASGNGSEHVIRVVVEQQAPVNSDTRSSFYKCPDCGGDLTLVGDGVGNYSFRCLRCYEGGE